MGFFLRSIPPNFVTINKGLETFSQFFFCQKFFKNFDTTVLDKDTENLL